MYSSTLLILTAVFSIAPMSIAASGDDVVTWIPTPTVSIPSTLEFSSLHTMLPGLTIPHELDAAGGECEHRAHAKGPQPFPDTPLAFLQMPEFSAMARDAPTPWGYRKVYQDEHASSVSEKYITHDTMETYSTHDCAWRCDKIKGCEAFNVFFERTPTLNLGQKCRNILASSVIKCALWGNLLNKSDATNTGYMRFDFQVVIAGSNAYKKASGASRNAASSAQMSAALGLFSATLVSLVLR